MSWPPKAKPGGQRPGGMPSAVVIVLGATLLAVVGTGYMALQRPCLPPSSSGAGTDGSSSSSSSGGAALGAVAPPGPGAPHWLPPPAGAKTNASIVVIVTTKAGSFDRRNWLRAQFARNVALLAARDAAAGRSVVFKFAIGTQGVEPSLLNKTRAEEAAHGDMLHLNIIDGNTPDPPPEGTDTATVLKVIHGVTWAVARYNFPWFVRLGDDSYFRVDHFVLNVAPRLPSRETLFGYAEDPQLGWRFQNTVTIKRYPSGMGFMFTYDVADYIARNGPYLYKGYPEDAVVGVWLAGTRAKIVHDARFSDWVWKRCSNDSIMIHKHNYGKVRDDGVMDSCFPEAKPNA